jgi:hypothetical protein
MTDSSFIYKCRRCGSESKGLSSSYDNIWGLFLAYGAGGIEMAKEFIRSNILIGGPLSETSIHQCDDNKIDISDLIGVNLYK